jgi:integrase
MTGRLYLRLRGRTWHVQARDADGRMRSRSLGVRDPAAAETLAAELEARWARGEPVFAAARPGRGGRPGPASPERARLDDPLALAVEEHLEYRRGYLSPEAWARTRGRLRRCAAALAGRAPATLTRAELEGFLARVARTRAAGTHNQYLLDLRGFCAWLVLERRRADNPLAGLRPRRLPEYVPAYLSRDERRRVLAAARGQPLETALLLALNCGLRLGELQRLVWTDLFLAPPEAAYLVVRVAKGRRSRQVPIPESAARRLRELRPRRPGPRTCVCRTRLGALRGRAAEGLAGIARRAGLDRPLGWNLCRHTVGSLRAQQGDPLQEIAADFGHRDVRTTVRHYAALAPLGRRRVEIREEEG